MPQTLSIARGILSRRVVIKRDFCCSDFCGDPSARAKRAIFILDCPKFREFHQSLEGIARNSCLTRPSGLSSSSCLASFRLPRKMPPCIFADVDEFARWMRNEFFSRRAVFNGTLLYSCFTVRVWLRFYRRTNSRSLIKSIDLEF